MPMKIISVINEKGGVGKTTTSLNVAHELNRRGNRTLLIDLDKQCDLTKTLYRDQWEVGIREFLEGKCSLNDIFFQNEHDMLFLLGSKDIRNYEDNGVNLRRYLEEAGMDEIVEYVVIDHPPEINDATIKGLIASDYILVVTEVETLSIDNLHPLAETLDVINSSHDRKTNILGIVANKVDNRRNLAKQNLVKLKSMLGDILFETYIGTNTMVPYSIQMGSPVRKVHWSKAASQFSNLVDEMLERIEKYEC
jgi:chromosome partitioning protein